MYVCVCVRKFKHTQIYQLHAVLIMHMYVFMRLCKHFAFAEPLRLSLDGPGPDGENLRYGNDISRPVYIHGAMARSSDPPARH